MLYSENKDYDNCSYFCVFMTASCNNVVSFTLHMNHAIQDQIETPNDFM